MRTAAEHELRERRRQAAQEVEDREEPVAETILDIVTKDPKVEHVSTQMYPSGVHEHGGKQRWEIRGRIGEKPGRNERPLFNERVATAELDEEEQDVQRDQRIRDYREGSLAAVVVTDWKHECSSSNRGVKGRARTVPSRVPCESVFIRGLSRKRLDQSILKIEPLKVLLHTDALVASVGAHIVDVAERAVDTKRRDTGVAEVESVGRAGAHHRDDDHAREHIPGERLDRRHDVFPQNGWLTRVRVANE